MCGICGFLAVNDGAVRLEQAGGAATVIRQMSDMIAHRGPDGEASWLDDEAGLALGHRRLAILELSSLGQQPMASADGRYVIVFNGEIYNFPDLRRRLEVEGHGFRSHSDTEVLLAACAAWGVRRAVREANGIFAFALWDREERVLTLARDHLGVKPLYWGVMNGWLLFGSQPKAMRPHPAFDGAVDRDTLAAYVRFGYVPAPYSIHAAIQKLEPGTLATFRSGRKVEFERFWDFAGIATRGTDPDLDRLSDGEAIDLLEQQLGDAVERQMIADVPLGAFLSGGIDSTSIVAMMRSRGAGRLRSFTIGFDEGGYDEADHARAVASHLGTEHTELRLTAAQALDTIPRLPTLYDEPFADSSQIPTLLVSEMTRQSVTVALSGDGGDELFAGYNRHAWGNALWRRLAPVPSGIRRAGAGILRGLPPSAWDQLFSVVPSSRRPRQPGDKLHKLAGVLAARDFDDFYRGLVSQWQNPSDLVLGGLEPEGRLRDADTAGRIPDLVARMQYLDAVTYLPDDILAKVDRASMGVSLEARVPFLDPTLVEWVWGLPGRFKLRNGQGKWLLRQMLYRHVPESLMARPKSGFAIPLDSWLRGPLRDWAEHLLDERRLAEDGCFNPAPIRQRWQEHLAGTRNHQHALWVILMFQAWSDQWQN